MMQGQMSWLHKLAGVLVVVGALNWGLVGAFEWNLVEVLLGSWPVVVRVVYVLVGLSGLMTFFSCWHSCGMSMKK